MAVTVSEDIYGSQHVLGYDSAQGERVIRRHFVEGITGTKPLEDAILAVTGASPGVTAFATRFPLLAAAGMQRQNVTAKQIGVGRFIVEEMYSWNSGGSWGQFPTSTLIEYKLGFEGVQCYTVGAIQTNGLPGTIAQGGQFKDSAGANALGFVPQPYTYMRPVIRVGRPIATNSNPLNTLWFQVLGKVNNTGLTLAGFSYPAGTLRFDGMELSVVSNSSAQFQGVMSFTAAPSFEEPRLYKTGGTWEVQYGLNLASGSFPAFP